MQRARTKSTGDSNLRGTHGGSAHDNRWRGVYRKHMHIYQKQQPERTQGDNARDNKRRGVYRKLMKSIGAMNKSYIYRTLMQSIGNRTLRGHLRGIGGDD